MKKLIIAGDSWGCGEWGDDEDSNYTVLHKGLEQYFTDIGVEVENLSAGGISNRTVCFRLESFLKKYPNYDGNIIWFQTDSIRDYFPYNILKENITFENLLQYQDAGLKNTYTRLDALNRKILCLGGATKLNLDLISSYKNLQPTIPSIPEFIFNDYTHPIIWTSDWVNLINKQFSLDCIDKFLYYKKIQDQLAEKEIYQEFFWPDGNHPNRHGIKKVFDYLINNENLY